ncbi:MAG: YhcH/YjgK/YiaL family protein [Bacteroidetes bacterium]|nr:YhcH/YjgK/YiaL family protein [Bacteroidota bacterium]
MIKDTIDKIGRYKGVIPGWEMFFDSFKIERLLELDEGRYDLEDGQSFFIITHYQTKKFQDTQFEVHRKFIDIQIVLEGVELIYAAPLSRTVTDSQGYDGENDIQFGEASVPDILLLKEGDFVVFYPEDAHNPGCSLGKYPIGVKKAIFKVPVPGVW